MIYGRPVMPPTPPPKPMDGDDSDRIRTRAAFEIARMEKKRRERMGSVSLLTGEIRPSKNVLIGDL